MKNELKLSPRPQTLIRVCHMCLKLNEGPQEMERCAHCQKSFLPLRYFEKIHAQSHHHWSSHFSSIEDIDDEDLIQGLFVRW